ncbi:hypothetical protein RND71_033645 [Anisodus tanguticus]|uniref:Non-haem dioxygenase N-terminal domain-containing protein n=1 Tax=Anisodus tanguticus TaxID=243964 RepID=A0AAE1V1M4_9SOLA|nr:hypothetical protein RND71_033645 [Anisodus tanguticus]
MEEASSRTLGDTLKVPSVQELVKQELAAVPLRYIRDDIEKTSTSILMPQVPVIDMEKLLEIGHDNSELERLHFACKEWGFFQAVNHGVSSSLVEKVKSEIQAFFDIPMEEKKFEQQEGDVEVFRQAFVFSGRAKFRLGNIMEGHCKEFKSLAISILCQFAKALRMDENEMRPEKPHLLMEEASSRTLGSTLKVPSARELAKQEIAAVPPRYIRNEIEKTSSSIILPQVPVIDMEKLLAIGDDDSELERLHLACKEWGFFQNLIGLVLAVRFDRGIYIFSTMLSERIMESTPAKMNFGKSLLVPSVQELAKEHLTNIPARYVRPEQESPAISAGAVVPTVSVIDLQKLTSGDSMDSELQKLHSACQQWGLPVEEKKKLWQQEECLEGFGQAFVVSEEQKLDWHIYSSSSYPQSGLVSEVAFKAQVINHAVTPSLLEDFKRENIELFSLPMEEKKKLGQHEDSFEGFGQAFVVSEEQKCNIP